MSRKKKTAPPAPAIGVKARRHTRLKIATGPWQKGHVFTDMPPNQADEWYRRGIIEFVDGGGPYRSPENRMMTAPVTK